MTQLEVIKKFMASLTEHGYTSSTNDGSENPPSKAMLDLAIRACSSYDGIDDAISKFLAAAKSAKTNDEFYAACGINTKNADTGGITGLDAGGTTEKTADTTVLEIGNLYQATDNAASQVIYTGDNGWLVKATSNRDTIFSAGEDSINAGAGNDVINISGRTAVILTGGNSDTVSVESGVKTFTIKDFSKTTTVLGAENYSSVATANSNGTSVVSFTLNGYKSGDDVVDADLPKEIIFSEDVGNLANEKPPETEPTTPPTEKLPATTEETVDSSPAERSGVTSSSLYTVDLSTVNTLSGYFVNGDSSFKGGNSDGQSVIGTVESNFDPSYLDNDGNGNLSFTYRGLKVNIKGLRNPSTGKLVSNGAITASNIASLNKTSSSKYYQYVIIAGLYKWWLKEALDLNDEANGINFTDGRAAVNEIDLYFEDNQSSSWLAYVGHSTYSNGKVASLELVINAKYFSGLKNEDDPNCDGYITVSGGTIGGRLDRTIAHEFNHAVFASNVAYFSELPMFIKEGMAELVHGVDDNRATPMNALLAGTVNNAGSLLDDYVNLNLNNSSQIKTSGTSNYPYAGGYMFLRWLANTAANSETIPIGQITARVELRTNGIYYVSTTNDGTSYERPASTVSSGENRYQIGEAKNNIYTANGTVKQSITYSGGAWTISGAGSGATILSNSSAKGNDSISATANNYIDAGDGADTVEVSGDYNSIKAGAGDDKVIIETGDYQEIDLGDGSNVVSASQSKNNSIVAGSGNDSIYLQYTTNSTIQTGDGSDTVNFYYSNASVNVVELGAGDDSVNIVGNDNTIDAGDGNDKINLSNDNNSLDAGAGDDLVSLYGGGNTIIGGKGNDSILQYSNSAGKNYFVYNSSFGKDTILGFKANDTLLIPTSFTASQKDSVITIKKGNTVKGTITLQNSTVTSAKILPGKVEEVIDASKEIVNTANDTLVEGTDSDDNISNEGNSVTITSGDGDDTVRNTGNNVSLDAGEGNDSIGNHSGKNNSLYGGGGDDTIDNHADDLTLVGGSGNDYIYNDSKEVWIEGGEGNDSIYNDGADVVITGGTDNDLISLGSNATDNYIVYDEGDGNDTIEGFNTTSTLSIADENVYTPVKKGNDLILTRGSDSITLKDAATLSAINIEVSLSGGTGGSSDVAYLRDGDKIAYYTSIQDAINAAQENSNGKITLLKDYTGSIDFSTFKSGSEKFTIDLNEHTLTANAAIKLGSNAQIAIENGKLTSTNTINTLIENNGGYLDLIGVNVDATKLKSGGYLATNGSGTLIFEEGTSVNSNDATIKNSGKLRISGLTTPVKANILLSGSESVEDCQLILEDSTVNGNLFVDSAAAGADILSGAHILIDNGSFTKSPSITADNLYNLLICKVGDDKYQVGIESEFSGGSSDVAYLREGNKIAYYTSIQDAINAAQENSDGKITLLKDYTGSLDFSSFDSKYNTFTIDLNGHTLTANAAIKLGDTAQIAIENGKLTSTNAINTLIENNGGYLDLIGVNVDATKLKSGGYLATNGSGTLAFKEGTSVNSNDATIKNSGGELIISGLKTPVKANILLSGSERVTENQLTLENSTINGNLFVDSAAAGADILNNIMIDNGSFTKSPSITGDNFHNLLICKVGDDKYQVGIESEFSGSSSDVAYLRDGNKIVYYTSIQDAINAAQENSDGKITLLKNYTGSLDFSNFKSDYNVFTVDLNGHTLTANAAIKLGDTAQIAIENGKLTSTNTINTLIENNGGYLDLIGVNVDATKLKAGGYLATNGSGTLAFEEGTSVNSNDAIIKNSGGELIISGLTTPVKANILLSGSESVEDYQLILEDATINGDLFLDSAAAKAGVLSNAHISINNGSFTKNAAITADNLADAKLAAYQFAEGSLYKIGIPGTFDEYLANSDNDVSITTNSGNDTISNTGSNVTINSGTGNDSISNSGANVLFQYNAGDGNDTITGFNATSTISISGGEYTSTVKGSNLILGVGKESITLVGAANLADSININGKLSEIIVLDNSAVSPMTVPDGVKIVDGSKRTVAINITGNALANSLVGGNKGDTLDGAAGDDTLTGGDGSDLFVYSGGKDIITDYDTKDKISVSSSASLAYADFAINGKDLILSYGATDSLTVTGGKDKEISFAVDKKTSVNIYNEDGIFDTKKTALTIASSAESLDATKYSALVTIDGALTNAISITGNSKANKIFAGDKGSTLNGGAGNDTLTGGKGVDVFVYNGNDKEVIENYGEGDKISLGASLEIADVTTNKNGDTTVKIGKNSITVKKATTMTFVRDGVETIFSGDKFVSADKNSVTLPATFAKTFELGDYKNVDGAKLTNVIKITGNEAANSIIGGPKNDTLDGAAGSDTLTGGTGNDVFVYSGGNDVITDYDAKDKISVSSSASLTYADFAINGKDLILGYGENNSLTIEDGKDKNISFAIDKKTNVNVYNEDGIFDTKKTSVTLSSSAESLDTAKYSALITIDATATDAISIAGTAKANKIIAGDKGSTLNGGKGKDTLVGGKGADIFIYNSGDDNDIIENYGEGDKISLAASLEVADVTTKNGNTTVKIGKNSITLKKATAITFAQGENETLFSDGKFVNATENSITLPATFDKTFELGDYKDVNGSKLSNAIKITGNALDNSIIGSKGNDTLDGAAGSDTLTGGTGNDLFIYNGGEDLITDYEAKDKISVAESLSPADYAINEDGDLILGYGENNSLTIKNGKDKEISFVKGNKTIINVYNEDGIFDTKKTAVTLSSSAESLDTAKYPALVTIDATETDAISIAGTAKINKIFAGDEGSTLNGGKGNDTLTGGKGVDIFVYSAGDGNDVIEDYGTGDKISLAASLEVADVITKKEDAVIKIAKNTITVKKANAITFIQDGIESLFSDGKFVSADKNSVTLPATFAKAFELGDYKNVNGSKLATAIKITGNDSANSITGSDKGDTLDGATGDDTLTGGKGADVFVYSGGKDVITDYDAKDRISVSSSASLAYAGFTISDDKDLVLNYGEENSLTIKDGNDKNISFAKDKKTIANVYNKDGIFDVKKTSMTITSAANNFNATGYTSLITIDGSETNAIEILGNDKANKIYAGDKGSTLRGDDGSDTLYGGDGIDIFVYNGEGKDVINDYDTGDKVSLSDDLKIDDVITKNGNIIVKIGKNSLTVNKATAITFAQGGKETLFNGGVFVDGDSVTLPATFDKTFKLGNNYKSADASKVSKAIKITGNTLNNVIIGSGKNDTLENTTGDDTLTGGDGNDVFIFSGGNVLITDYAETDKVSLSSKLSYKGFEIDDNGSLILNYGSDNSLTIQKGKGKNISLVKDNKTTVNVYDNIGIFDAKKTALTIASSATSLDAGSYSTLVTINGAATGAIPITGNDKSNRISAGSNGSTLNGGAGSDTLVGGGGADVFVYKSGEGNDVIEKYATGDIISLSGNTAIADITTKKTDTIIKIGSNSLTVKNASNITFVEKNSTKTLSGETVLDGSTAKVYSSFKGTLDLSKFDSISTADASLVKGSVTLKGSSSPDYLIGGSGKDSLTGGPGNDTLWGGASNDSLFGGDGNDTFIFQVGDGTDYIMDYKDGDSLKVLNKSGKEISFGKASFSGSTLTLDIDGGGKVIFNSVSSSTPFNINGTAYKVSGKTLAKA